MKTLIILLLSFSVMIFVPTSYSAVAYATTIAKIVKDLSDSDIDTSAISEAATDDAQDYFASHNSQKAYDGIANVGLSHAMKNGYSGNSAYFYMEYFDVAYRALYKDQ
jgi:hypothetical protein